MLRIKVISIITVILLASGCGEISSSKGQFEVRVLSSSSGFPVAGATISGGIDWTAFEVKTNDEGIALLPGSARGEWARIYKNNFFPYHVESLSPTHYFIKPTPKKFKLIGDISGWSIRFDSGTIITVDYQGGYHLYSYNDQGIIEIASAQIPKCIRETQLHGDRLWFSTHDDGIYVYSLEDPFQPVQLFHLAIPGYLGSFAMKDSIIVVGNPWDNDSVRVFNYNTNGDFQEIARFGNHLIEKMAFIGNYLVILNYYDCLPVIYDLKDLANPCLIYKGVEPEYWYGFLFRNYLVLIPNLDFINETTTYKLINLSDPAHPSTSGFFSADSKLFEIVDDRIAIGRYYLWTGATSVLIGDINQGFKTIAIITDHPWVQIFLHESEGCAPPYFIIGERLWKLEDY
jgi:hypothetical protein